MFFLDIEMDLTTNQLNEMLWVDFNQDYTSFAVATETGYKVFQADPLSHTHSRVFEGSGGLSIVSMLFRSNVLALVGGGRNPRYPLSKVILWDDKDARAIAELTFRMSVKVVKLRRDIVVVGVESKIYVYRFSDLSLVDSMDTCVSDMHGLVAVAGSPDRVVVAGPGNVKGKVNVCFYDPQVTGTSVAVSSLPNPLSVRLKTTSIQAHESSLALLSLNFEGTRLATASIKGTLIRVFDTTSGERLFELRRGAEKVDIHSISFSPNSEWLAVSSDKGTIHVFSLKTNLIVNQKSSLSTIASVLPSYFQSQWSFAQFRVPDYRTICAFGADPNTVICLCADGSYYKAKFDPVLGGEMTRVKFDRFD